MVRRALSVVFVGALLLVAGCSETADPAGDAATEASTSVEPSPPSGATTEPSETPGSPGAEEPGPGPDTSAEAGRLLQRGLDALRKKGVVDFRHTFTSGSTLLSESTGRAFLDDSWRASTSFHDPQTDEVIRMDTRGVDGAVFMQMLDWDDDMAGCWLEMRPDEYPVGQLAMTRDLPAYVGLLGAVDARGLDPESDAVVIGQVGLRAAIQLLTGPLVERLALTPEQVRTAKVPVNVYLDDEVITDVSMRGSDIADALDASGADLADDADVALRSIRVAIRYRPAAANSEPVTAPEAGLVVVSPADESTPGCRA